MRGLVIFLAVQGEAPFNRRRARRYCLGRLSPCGASSARRHLHSASWNSARTDHGVRSTWHSHVLECLSLGQAFHTCTMPTLLPRHSLVMARLGIGSWYGLPRIVGVEHKRLAKALGCLSLCDGTDDRSCPNDERFPIPVAACLRSALFAVMRPDRQRPRPPTGSERGS